MRVGVFTTDIMSAEWQRHRPWNVQGAEFGTAKDAKEISDFRFQIGDFKPIPILWAHGLEV